MSKSGFSIADLQQGAKKLNTVEAPADSKGSKAGGEENDVEALTSLGIVCLTVYSFKSSFVILYFCYFV